MTGSKTTTKPKRAYRKTSETQKIIFDTAMDIMSEKGFQGTTVRDICAQAHIPIGTFYNCYKSKVDILKSIYDSGDKFMANAMEAVEEESALVRLHTFVSQYAKLNEQTGLEVMRVLFYPSNDWFAHTRPMQILVEEIIMEGQNNGEIRGDRDPDLIVNYIFDIIRGVCYNWCVYDGSFNLSQRMEEHFVLLCDQLKA